MTLVSAYPGSTFATVTIQLDGRVFKQVAPAVLGEGDEKKEENKEEKKEEKREEMKKVETKEEKREEPKKVEQKQVEEKKEEQRVVENKPVVETKRMELKERLIEIKSNKGTGRIKEVQMERGKEKTEIQIEREEVEAPETIEDDTLEIETEDGVVKVASGEAENELEVEHGGVKAKTEFPLSVDPVTKQLTVTTPGGVKNVSVLPEKALSVISELGLVDSATNASKLKMKFENGQLVYKIEGTKKKKLFGIIPFTVKQDAVVSAETGAMISKSELTFFEKIMSAFSR